MYIRCAVWLLPTGACAPVRDQLRKTRTSPGKNFVRETCAMFLTGLDSEGNQVQARDRVLGGRVCRLPLRNLDHKSKPQIGCGQPRRLKGYGRDELLLIRRFWRRDEVSIQPKEPRMSGSSSLRVFRHCETRRCCVLSQAVYGKLADARCIILRSGS